VRAVVISLFIILSVIPHLANAEAEEFTAITIANDDYWSHTIERPNEDGSEKVDIKITIYQSDEKPYDVYLLHPSEFEMYNGNDDFSTCASRENISGTVTLNFTAHVRDKGDHYLVVDNRDNVREDDAYANETITVDITIERIENEDEDEIEQVIFGTIFGLFGVAILVMLGVLLWIVLEPRYFPQAKSKKFRELTRKPALQHMPLNPKVRMGRERSIEAQHPHPPQTFQRES